MKFIMLLLCVMLSACTQDAGESIYKERHINILKDEYVSYYCIDGIEYVKHNAGLAVHIDSFELRPIRCSMKENK